MVKYMMIGGITLDDTVTQTGRVVFNAAGGNSIYSALGARIWANGIGIVSRIGLDYPQDYLNILEDDGIDITGIRQVDAPSQHLWLLYEKDGSRQFVFLKSSGIPGSEIDPTPDQIPDDYLRVKMAHLSAMGYSTQHKLAKFLVQNKIDYSYDITQASMLNEGNEYSENFATLNSKLLLPSIEEIELIYGKQPLLPLLEKIAASGPRYIVVKMGSQGSIAFDAVKNQAYHIPVFPVDVIDPTGAGDAYCGGFMVGFHETGSVLEAGIYGTVSSSFAIQDFGSLHLLKADKKEVEKRAAFVRKQVEPVSKT